MSDIDDEMQGLPWPTVSDGIDERSMFRPKEANKVGRVDDLTAMRDRARAANEMIVNLSASGGEKWRMSIPVQKSDSDMLLFQVVSDLLTVSARLEATEIARQNLFNAAKEEIESLRMVLDIVKADIEEAITSDEGLDGGDGENAMQMIDEARAGKFPPDLSGMFDRIQEWRKEYYAGPEE